MLNTIRTILVMRGYRHFASALSFVEISVYTIGLSMVINYINDNIFYLIFYALGFSIGVYLGMILENKIALGYSVIEIFSASTNYALAQELRNRGYGVTMQNGYGKDGDRLIMTVLTPRTNEADLRSTISQLDPAAFFISYSANYIHGGFWTKRINKKKIKTPSSD